jgi:large subunit ribosomal protein L17
MVTSLFRYERMETTKAKALAIRKTAEKMITRAKQDSVHNRRIIAKDITDEAILDKLFTESGLGTIQDPVDTPEFSSLAGGGVTAPKS